MNWVAAGLSKDLPAAVVMPALWQGVELALWRSMSGKLSAWKDRCPHRGMRLSHGFVRGETLSCIYHGWVYGTNGACSRIPAHPALMPPATIRPEVFDCREADGVIWVGQAASDVLPDLAGLRAVRSLSVQAGATAVVQALPGMVWADGMLRGETPVGEVCLLLSPGAENATCLHVLCGPGATEIAVSRWVESLRRLVEHQVAA